MTPRRIRSRKEPIHKWLRGAALMTLLCVRAVAVDIDEVRASSSMYSQAPELAEQVQAGRLPMIDERLPLNPLVIQPLERVGVFGGTWHLGMKRQRDHGLFIRYIAYENLLRWDPRWTKVIPNVAQSFETNTDASTYTFRLRRNMKWSDGHPFTADDIMFWYEDVLLDKTLTPKPPSALVVNGKLVKVIKIDDFTVKFIFDDSYGLFPQILAQPHLVDATAYPRHYLKQFHPRHNPAVAERDRKETAAGGVALFRAKFGAPLTIDDPSRWQNPELPVLNAWVQETPYAHDLDRVRFKRNPYYWKVDTAGNQLPYIDRVECAIRDTAEEIANLAVEGRIDMQRRGMDSVPKTDFEKTMREHDFDFFETLSSFSNTMVIALNLTHPDAQKRAIYQNKEFRIGLSHAIDRGKIIDTVPGMHGQPAQVAPRPETPFYDKRFSDQFTRFDVQLANRHLDGAGISRVDAQGFRLDSKGNHIRVVIEYTDFQTGWANAAESVAADWRAVGIEAVAQKYTRDVLYTRKADNLHDAVIWIGDGGLSVILEPRWYLPYSHESNFAPLWQRWYNGDPRGETPPGAVKRQMALYDQIKATADAQKQSRLMKEILDIARDQFYVMGISLPTSSIGIVKNNFHNVPAVLPYSWIYPTPAPTNPCQYFIAP
ncbi:MAG: ABC transporter substrate-binding protein [Pseudomonadota bacterium]